MFASLQRRLFSNLRFVICAIVVLMITGTVWGYFAVESALRQSVAAAIETPARSWMDLFDHMAEVRKRGAAKAAAQIGEQDLTRPGAETAAVLNIVYDTINSKALVGFVLVDASGRTVITDLETATGSKLRAAATIGPAHSVASFVSLEDAETEKRFVVAVPVPGGRGTLAMAFDPVSAAWRDAGQVSMKRFSLVDRGGNILLSSDTRAGRPARMPRVPGARFELTSDWSGERVASVAAWSKSNNWAVVAEQPADIAFSSLQSIRTVLLVTLPALLVVLALLSLLGWNESRRSGKLSGHIARVRKVVDSLPHGVFVTDAKGACLYVNAAYSKITGLPLEAALGDGWLESIHRDDRERIAAAWSAFTEGRGAYHEETRFENADGWTSLCVVRAERVQWDDGETGFTGSVEDITTRRAEENDLKRERERMRLVLESAREGCWDWDLDVDLMVCSEVMLGMLGVEEMQLCGPRELYVQYVHPEDRYRLQCALTPHLEGHSESFECEYRLRSADGDWWWVLDRGKVVEREPNGRPVRMVGAVTSIQERKEFEEALVEATQYAELASKAKSDFLAMMSHEIRTPMNGVIGMTSLLLESELTQEQREYAEIVRVSGEALLTIINDILDFSKIEAGKMELESIDFSPRQMLEDVVDLMAEKAAAKRLELNAVCDPRVPALAKGDPGRLRQVVLNLFSNALKFTESGEVVIRLLVESASPRATFIRCEVTDTGIGIPKAAQDRLFQSFSQVDSSTSRKFGGTGLGLAICRKLSEMMGGGVGLTSEQGKGSTFWFTAELPASEIPAPAVSPIAGKRALVLDSSATTVQQLTFLCQASGVEAAGGLADAIDLVLLHARQVDATGWGILDELQARKVPVVFVVPAWQREKVEVAQAAGCADVLVAPFRQKQFVRAVTGLLAPGSGASGSIAALSTAVNKASLWASTLGHRPRVLLAEDNAVNQKVAMRMLDKLGVETVLAADGSRAVVLSAEGEFDLILMDCHMPRMNGYQASAAIRRREKASGRRTPIVALTANAMQGDRDHCLEAGMDDYLAKPVRASELEEMLEKWFTSGNKPGGKMTYPQYSDPNPAPDGALASPLPASAD